jgi:hypothetical protein
LLLTLAEVIKLMTRNRASIKGIGASIFYSAPGDSVPAERSEPRSAAEKSIMAPFAELAADDNPTGERLGLRRIPADAAGQSGHRPLAAEPGPVRTRPTERPSLPRPRLHLVPPVQEVEAASVRTVKLESLPASGPARTTPLTSTPAPLSASVVLERAPDGGPDAPDATPDPTPPAVNPCVPAGDLKATTPEQESTAHGRLGDDLPKAMLQEIGVLYERVTNTTGAQVDMAERAMDLLSEARDLLLLGNAGDFNVAERKVNEAKLILNRIDQSRRWSNTYGWGLLLYELAMFVAFVMAIIFDRGLAEWFGGLTGAGASTASMSAVFAPWTTMLWGGIGGIVGALYSLHWHVAELQDFDRQYSFWYIVQPFMGMILGGIIHLVIVAGMLALVPVNGLGDGAKVASAAVNWFPSLVACLAGFRQKFAYELMDNIMKAVGRQPVSAVKSNL